VDFFVWYTEKEGVEIYAREPADELLNPSLFRIKVALEITLLANF